MQKQLLSYDLKMKEINFEIFQFFIEFKYKPINALMWAENFELGEIWTFIIIKNGGRTITRGYMNKSPQLQKTDYPISIYSKNRFYHLDCEKGVGYAVISTAELPSIQGLEITKVNSRAYTTVCTNEFDFHTMMTVIDCYKEETKIIEKKQPSLTEAEIFHQGIYIKAHANNLSYTGEDKEKHEIFKEFCKEAWAIYQAESPKLIELFNSISLNKPEKDPNLTHFAIAHYTWSRASRENQRQWPVITREPLNDKSIEFPAKSGHWYSPQNDNQFVGLAMRHDDHPEELIPRMYKKDHRKIENSNLYYYIKNNTSPKQKITIPIQVKKSPIFTLDYCKIIKSNKKIKEYDGNTQRIKLNYDGSILSTDFCPEVITFKNLVIGTIILIQDQYKKNFIENVLKLSLSDWRSDNREGEDIQKTSIKAQVINQYNQRTMIYISPSMMFSEKENDCLLNLKNMSLSSPSNKEDKSYCWIHSSGPKIDSIITIPWNYKQIIHDYNKLNRFKKGPLMDLTHIGIVNPDAEDIITFPDYDPDILYKGNDLETHRLSTFKPQDLVFDNLHTT